MRRALEDAGIRAELVDHVNAHATGTPVGDLAEARAVARVFSDRVPVSSTKGALGHTIAAAGAVEAAVCIAAMEGGWLPGTAGLQQVDPGCPARILADPVHQPSQVMMSNSFGFGGQNASLVLAAPEGHEA